jgi:manganese/zinc/iron transport system permease protein
MIFNIDFSDANLRWVLLGSMLLGIAAATLGSFAFLRGRSLMGDALAHAALPGVCCAFLFAEWGRSQGWFDIGSKSLPLLLLGAGISGVIAAWCIAAVARHSRIKEDTSQAIILSVFFGAGVVLLTRIQHSGAGNQSGLDKFLFGQAASMVGSDLITMSGVAAILCLLTYAFYKELKLLCFDADFGRGLGFPMPRLDGFLLAMIVASVVIGLQAVGVVLISAMLIIPPAAARFWTEKLHRMVPLAALLGGLSGALGALLSALAPRMPTGPLIVLAATAFFIFSLLFAPRRGVLARGWLLFSTRSLVRRENVLRDVFEATEAAVPPESNGASVTQFPGISEDELLVGRGTGAATLRATLSQLQKKGLLQFQTGRWRLTDMGLRTAYEIVRRHRLWKMFLMYETSLGAQTVDRDADDVEHFLTPDAVTQLESLLREHELEPRLKPV